MLGFVLQASNEGASKAENQVHRALLKMLANKAASIAHRPKKARESSDLRFLRLDVSRGGYPVGTNHITGIEDTTTLWCRCGWVGRSSGNCNEIRHVDSSPVVVATSTRYVDGDYQKYPAHKKTLNHKTC